MLTCIRGTIADQVHVSLNSKERFYRAPFCMARSHEVQIELSHEAAYPPHGAGLEKPFTAALSLMLLLLLTTPEADIQSKRPGYLAVLLCEAQEKSSMRELWCMNCLACWWIH